METHIMEIMLEECCRRNETVRWCREQGAMMLDAFVRLQAAKVLENRKTAPLMDPGDFVDLAAHYTEERLGNDAAQGVSAALHLGAVLTADHLGSLFCSQSFQGDLLYAALLRELGCTSRFAPVLCGGQVTLGSSTYARGISLYTSKTEKQNLPLFPDRHHLQLACCAEPVKGEQLTRFRKRLFGSAQPRRVKQALDEILRALYETREAQQALCFSDQVTTAGAALSRGLFRDEGPVFVYLETEALVRPLVQRELADGKSLFSQLILDPVLRRRLSETLLPDGSTLAALLFRAVDEKGRMIPLCLNPDGTLTGLDRRKQQVCYPADAETLSELLEKGTLLPGVLTLAIVLCFERGLTWLGGMFQSIYLPQWQSALIQVLRDTPLEELTATVGACDCTGYLSGPMFALCRWKDFAAGAGPAEFWMAKPTYTRIQELIARTRLWDAHVMGLAEMYFDLVSREERAENWYERIAEELYQTYPENGVTDEHS